MGVLGFSYEGLAEAAEKGRDFGAEEVEDCGVDSGWVLRE